MKKYFLYDHISIGTSCTYLVNRKLRLNKKLEQILLFQKELINALGYVYLEPKIDESLIYFKCINGKTLRPISGKEFLKTYQEKLKPNFLFLALEEVVDNV